MRIAIYTLGCKVNQYETQAMEQELAAQGHELVDFEQAADAYIINTCSVTAVSDKKSRQMIRRAKNRNPAAIIAACGCYVQTHTDEAAALGIDLIGGTGQRMEFLHQLLAAAEEKQTRILVDDALRRMNRRYDTTRFTESALLLHRFFPDCALTTDLIVGFPGETEEEFSTTLGFIRRCGFAQIHVFPYSVRPGTKAADMEQVPKNIKEERAARAGEVAAALHEEYLQSCVGKTLPVLFEQPGAPGFYTGHAPNYMEVSAPGENLHNCLRPVRITAVEGGILKGEIEP